MTENQVTLALDIGGSHVSAAAVYAHNGAIVPRSKSTTPVDSSASDREILDGWSRAASQCIGHLGSDDNLLGIGVAMPGPFDYNEGVSRMSGIGKFDNLYGVNVRTALKEALRLPADCAIIFRNDATCFLLGEQWHGAAQRFSDVIGITLGTGFGSAFMRNSEIVEQGSGVPQNGWLYNAPFRNTIADEWFTTRGLMGRLPAELKQTVTEVKQLAKLANDNIASRGCFENFGTELAEFLAPWISGFQPECVVIGGNIAKAWDLFAAKLQTGLSNMDITVEMRQAHHFEDSALIGAAVLPLKYAEPASTNITKQAAE